MSSSSTTQRTQHRQILTVLYSQGAIWRRCEGAGRRTGLFPETLLTELQNRYPTEGWEIEDLLFLLSRGVSLGIYKFLTDNVFQCVARVISPMNDDIMDFRFFANNSMVIQNAANRIYVDISPSNICIPMCTRIIGPIV